MSRVSDIRFVNYAVTDQAAEAAFYKDVWGLEPVASSDGMAYFAAAGDDENYVVRLRQADAPRIDLIGFAANSRADVDALHDQVVNAGGKVIAPPAPRDRLGGGYGFTFFDPDGHAIEVSSDVAARQPRPIAKGESIPKRISHIVMHAPKVAAAVAFYEKALGFKVSDWLGDFMCFLRCNSAHHRLAFLPGPPCLNHIAYDMLSADEMMRGVGRLKKAGVNVQWGPGRHTAGNNTFSYFVTPGGNVVEYTAELEDVDDATWQSSVHKPTPELMDQWGAGVGSPQELPPPRPDGGLWQAPVA